MPGRLDLLVAGLIGIGYPFWDYFNATPRMLRLHASGRPNARLIIYGEVIATLWIMAAVVAAVWIRAARPWSLMGLVLPDGWRLFVSAALVVLLLLFYRTQMLAIRRIDPAKRERIRASQAGTSPLIPRNGAERAGFAAVSFSAGVCEEFIYRGFMIWVLRPWLTLWGAALLSTVAFGAAHAYQGKKGMIRAGMVGAALAAVTLVTRSVVVAMVLHVGLDLVSGEATYALFAEPSTAASPTL